MFGRRDQKGEDQQEPRLRRWRKPKPDATTTIDYRKLAEWAMSAELTAMEREIYSESPTEDTKGRRPETDRALDEPADRAGMPSKFYRLLDDSHRIRLKPRRQWRHAFECLILAAAVIMFLVTMIVLAEVVGIT